MCSVLNLITKFCSPCGLQNFDKIGMTKILLVEDDSFISELYSAKFTKNGYGMEIAQNGEEALEILKKDKPDVILLDIVMPKVDGFEFLEQIKKDESLASIPVIILTNLSDEQNINRAMSLGANSYIIKSHFTPAEVVRRVEEVLENRSR